MKRKGCGIQLHSGDICWLCELECSGLEFVYVSVGRFEDENGILRLKIIAWQNYKSDLCLIKLPLEVFIAEVQRQYREE